jgi:hypothetical protein
MIVHTADVQDRDGAPWLMECVGSLYPWLRHVFADGGYAGDRRCPVMVSGCEEEWPGQAQVSDAGAPPHDLDAAAPPVR